MIDHPTMFDYRVVDFSSHQSEDLDLWLEDGCDICEHQRRLIGEKPVLIRRLCGMGGWHIYEVLP